MKIESARRPRRALHAGAVMTLAVLCVLLPGILAVVAGSVSGLLDVNDVGYPDSGMLLRIRDLVHAGVLYPDVNRPPYHITVYGPCMYGLYALAYAGGELAGIDPRLAVRVSVLIAFLASVALIGILARRLYGRIVAWLSVAFALSLWQAATWTTMIRGDFIGTAVSFLSLYLVLVSRSPWQVVAAAVVAGFALLVKQTFVTALLAVALWFGYQRRFKEASLWLAVGVLTVAAGYLAAWWREPLMLQHLDLLRRPIFEYRGALIIAVVAVWHPVMPFAVIGGRLALTSREAGSLLLAVFCGLSWLVAFATVPQVGSNINYFWEPLFASSILAGRGLFQAVLHSDPLRHPAMVIAWIVFFVLFAPFVAWDVAAVKQAYVEVKSHSERKARWEAFSSVIAGRKLLSTDPALTLLASSPELPEPFMNAMLDRRRTWSFAPVAAKLQTGSYDLVCIHKGELTGGRRWRGVNHWPDGMFAAVATRYEPFCEIEDIEVWLPRQRSSGSLLSDLSAAGCQPVPASSLRR